MSKTLTKHLQTIKDSQQGLFVPYIMAGDHPKGLDGLFETIGFLEKQGVSAIEVGVPWSDPVADGPIIELAGQRSLANGTNLNAILEKLQEQKTKTPLVLMSYFNPIFQYGLDAFVKGLSSTSVKGLIIPDLPFEHHDMIKSRLDGSDITLISLISLTTDKERQKVILDQAEGFIYAVAVNGTTGQNKDYSQSLDNHLNKLCELSSIPVLTGFGVSNLEDVKRFNTFSDGVIVGSKIVKELHQGNVSELADFIFQASHFKK